MEWRGGLMRGSVVCSKKERSRQGGGAGVSRQPGVGREESDGRQKDEP